MIWRIRDHDVFRRLTAEGRRARAGVLWCTFLPDPSASPPRVAFAIGRAIGPAVARNLVRRRLRSLLATSEWPAGFYLIGGRPGTAERTFAELSSDLTLLERAVRQSRASSAPPPLLPTLPPQAPA